MTKKRKLLLKINSDYRLESQRMKKWRKFGKTTTETSGEWTRERLEFIRDFDTRVYRLGLKSLKSK